MATSDYASSAVWREFTSRAKHADPTPFEEHWRTFERAYPTRGSESVPPIAWWPDEAAERSNLREVQHELGLENYDALHRFSVDQLVPFWKLVLERLGIVFDTEPDKILDLSQGVKQPSWLAGATLQIVRSCFTADPGKTAIVFGREQSARIETLTYGELDYGMRRFASGLRAMGLSAGDAVALYMPMTPACVIAYLGTIWAGCRVASIADSFPADELRNRLAISDARVIVTVSSYQRGGRDLELYRTVREAVSTVSPRVTAIVIGAERVEGGDLRWDDFLSDEPADEPFIADPYHCTNILFSSGTTGTPKAIPWTQLTPIKAAMDAHFHQDVHSDDVVCWPTNIGWMMGPWLIYASLINDAAMALYEGAPSGSGFTRFVRDARVSVLGVVPSLVRGLRASEAVAEGGWPDIRVLSSTGEASTDSDALWLMSRTHYRAPVIEYLGGTEIGGGHLAGSLVQPASLAAFSTPALGVDVVVLDEEGNEVGEGEEGELFLRAPALGLSQSLLNGDHDELYFGGTPTGPRGETLRRHGDQIARLHGGYFQAQGRADDTMNLGGIKISSIEIERVLNRHPSVQESAAVAVIADGQGRDELVAYVVLDPAQPAGDLGADLGRRVKQELNPLFKIHDVVAVNTLPRTASNKIMRRELRAAYTAGER